ncbi:Morn repeat protein [Pandoravirus inopinatum]|uniref:Morn repeat protein n=1 Tax=Pandoravirus inopinatum TaxID=1605721 RepID=A0A0B5J6I2_9VIRU|nr:Morn repeat protein [Pandoravirus inopinatum]AJF97370.1 Morn repeat protein [Pandoravirus inopinatum]
MKRHRGICEGADSLCDKANGPCASKRRRRNRRKDSRAFATPFFDRLPDELVLAILAALGDPRSLVSWGQTSRRHHELANDPLLWRRLCESHFGPLLHRNFAKWGKSWRWLYRAQTHEVAVTGPDVGAILVHVRDHQYIYWGDCRNGLPHGYGLALQMPTRHCDGSRGLARVWTDAADAVATTDPGYEGEWSNGQFDGYGTYAWPDGKHYEGDWRDSRRHGQGASTYANGDHYNGEWRNGERYGHGVCTYADGSRYEGEWDGGILWGKGLLVKPDGWRYQGDWRDKRHGYGVCVEVDGSRYEGRWRGGKRHGTGTWHYADGSSARGDWHHKSMTWGEVIQHRADAESCITDVACKACAVVANKWF